MRLQQVSLLGRRFSIQFGAIIGQFGNVIPWLDGLQDLVFATNGYFFRDQFLRQTGQDEDGVTAYQFIEGSRAKMFIGGVLAFRTTPEQFIDHRNTAVVEELASQGYGFVSCLQVRPPYRQTGIGGRMFTRAARAILRDHGPFWGVVSDPRLLPWYQGLGFQLRSPINNADKFWIISSSEIPSTDHPPS